MHRQLRRQARRDILRKSLAILIALQWSSLAEAILPRYSGLVLGTVALVLYAVVWLVLQWSVGVVEPSTLGWNTILAAELVAFFWRDAMKEAWAQLSSSGEGVTSGAPGHHGVPHSKASHGSVQASPQMLPSDAASMIYSSAIPGDHGANGMHGGTVGEQGLEESATAVVARFAFASVLLAAGIAWIAVAKRLRQRRLQQKKELEDEEQIEQEEQVGESMLDVEVDMHGLAVSWALTAAFNNWFLGNEWEEIVEEGKDPRFKAYYGFSLIIIVLLLAVFRMSEWCGVKEDGSFFLITTTSCGFWLGYLLNYQINYHWWAIFQQLPFLTEFWLSVSYPVFMLMIGSWYVASLGVDRENLADEDCICGARRRLRACISGSCKCLLGEHWGLRFVHVVTLGYQMCMALAFEELFHSILHDHSDTASGLSGLLLAVGLSAAWTLIVYLLPAEGVEHIADGETKRLLEKTGSAA